MICVLACLLLIQEDGLSPQKNAVLQMPRLEALPKPQIQGRVPAKSSLSQESLDEIKSIRKRIGLQIFKDKQSDAEFNQQLNRIQTAQKQGITIARPTVKPIDKLPPTVERPRIAGNRLNLIPSNSINPRISTTTRPSLKSNKSQNLKTAEALFEAIGQLDQNALQLEKEGQFEKSKKLRKLSRRMQKQARTLMSLRDN